MKNYYLNRQVTSSQLHDEGFRYDGTFFTKLYPVQIYRHGSSRIPVTWLRIRIDLEEKSYQSQVMRDAKNIDPTYYTEYGDTTLYRKKLNRSIDKIMKNLCTKEILWRRTRNEGHFNRSSFNSNRSGTGSNCFIQTWKEAICNTASVDLGGVKR